MIKKLRLPNSFEAALTCQMLTVLVNSYLESAVIPFTISAELKAVKTLYSVIYGIFLVLNSQETGR